MSVARFWEKPGTASVDNKGVRTYTRKWLFEQTAFSDNPPITWGGSGPSVTRYAPHPSDAGALAVSLDVAPAGDVVGHYEVTIQYTSKPFDSGNVTGDPTQSDQSVSPPDRPWTVSFSSVHSTRLLGPDDLDGTPVMNSAKQPFDPPPEIPCSNLQINITAFKPFVWPAGTAILTYQDAINDNALTMTINSANTATFPARTVRCTEYKATSHAEAGGVFWQLDLTLEYRVKPWNPVKVLDAGTVFIDSGSLPPQPIMDKTGKQVDHPVCLDGSGHVLTAAGTPVYKSFKGYYERNFATILT